MWKGLVAFLVVALAAQAHAAPARRGDRAPAFTARDTTGKLVKLADLKGKQNLLLVFWSTDGCSTQDDLKAIEKLRARYRGKPLAIFGVSADGTKAKPLARWLKARKVTFPHLVDEKLAINDDYGIIIAPVFVLVDQKGVVQSRRVGGGGAVLDALAKDVEELLREGKVTAREDPAPALPSG
ncbi:MAG TPA: TlpA family protein disulfide reductase [Armatimonadetes bacterium]|nr:TlpA family protein disulfide reductase [Armatimonadota bacterium]